MRVIDLRRVCDRDSLEVTSSTQRGGMRIPRIDRLMFAVALLLCLGTQVASPEDSSNKNDRRNAQDRSPEFMCSDRTPESAAGAALQFVCRHEQNVHKDSPLAQTIVVGFVGGFANPNDAKHPEALFAAYLRGHYGSNVHAQVFSNHDERQALRYVMAFLDTNRDGVLSDEEKKSARIIIYGHSWGASQTAAFARNLQVYDIPVLLTIQLDIIGKFRQTPYRIPSNVENAINFYQSEGLLQGRSEIVALDASRTEIIGNFQLTYRRKHVNCDNYPWLARTFNKPHHEIENDPEVWSQVALLIDAKMSRNKPDGKYEQEIAAVGRR